MLVNQLCKELMLPSKEELLKSVSDNNKNFRVVILFKGTDKERKVFVPKKITKICQRFILENYLFELKALECVTSYKKGCSILDACLPHVGNKYFLHLDIKHFFNRMSWELFKNTIFKFFSDSMLANELKIKDEERFLRKVLCFQDRIVQGSVTSPFISNIYLYEFDDFLSKYVNGLPNGKYTRYSDDIYISSSSYISHEIIETIKGELGKYNLRLNYKKIDYSKLKTSVSIVGLSLKQNRDIVVKTSLKKKIKNEIWFALKDSTNATNFNRLFGYINFLKYFDTAYFNKLQIKYSKDEKLMLDRLLELKKQCKNKKGIKVY